MRAELNLKTMRERVKSICPVKQKRALLKSNPPRDSRTDGDEIKNVSTFGEAKTSPKPVWRMIISEPEHALKTWAAGARASRPVQPRQLLKNHLSNCPFFRSKPSKTPLEWKRLDLIQA
jgi:hypothetical protein